MFSQKSLTQNAQAKSSQALSTLGPWQLQTEHATIYLLESTYKSATDWLSFCIHFKPPLLTLLYLLVHNQQTLAMTATIACILACHFWGIVHCTFSLNQGHTTINSPAICVHKHCRARALRNRLSLAVNPASASVAVVAEACRLGVTRALVNRTGVYKARHP